MEEDQFTIPNYGDTDFGLGGFEIINIPEPEPTIEELLLENATESVIIPLENEQETNLTLTEAFGVKLDPQDDFWSVGMVTLIVTVAYIAKCAIDLFFAILLEKYKNKKE